MIIFKTMVLVQTQLTKELHSEFVWSATRGEDTASKIYSERASKRERSVNTTMINLYTSRIFLFMADTLFTANKSKHVNQSGSHPQK